MPLNLLELKKTDLQRNREQHNSHPWCFNPIVEFLIQMVVF